MLCPYKNLFISSSMTSAISLTDILEKEKKDVLRHEKKYSVPFPIQCHIYPTIIQLPAAGSVYDVSHNGSIVLPRIPCSKKSWWFSTLNNDVLNIYIYWANKTYYNVQKTWQNIRRNITNSVILSIEVDFVEVFFAL